MYFSADREALVPRPRRFQIFECVGESSTPTIRQNANYRGTQQIQFKFGEYTTLSTASKNCLSVIMHLQPDYA